MGRRILVFVLLVWLLARCAAADWDTWVAGRPAVPPVPAPTYRYEPPAYLEADLARVEARLAKWDTMAADLVAGEGDRWVATLEQVLATNRAGGPRWRYLVPPLVDLVEVARGERNAGDVDQLLEPVVEVDRIRTGWLRRAIADPCPRLQGELRKQAGLPEHYVPPRL